MTALEPFFFRERADHKSALGAFRRLNTFADQIDDPALRAIAIFKAIQKLEQLQDEEADPNALGAITLPDWVRAGFWDAMAVLVKKNPSSAGKKRPESFKKRSSEVMSKYSLWAAVEHYKQKHDVGRSKAVEAIGSKGVGDATRTVWRAIEGIDGIIEAANALNLKDQDGEPLPYVEARDLIPTQKFRLLMKKFA